MHHLPKRECRSDSLLNIDKTAQSMERRGLKKVLRGISLSKVRLIRIFVTKYGDFINGISV